MEKILFFVISLSIFFLGGTSQFIYADTRTLPFYPKAKILSISSSKASISLKELSFESWKEIPEGTRAKFVSSSQEKLGQKELGVFLLIKRYDSHSVWFAVKPYQEWASFSSTAQDKEILLHPLPLTDQEAQSIEEFGPKRSISSASFSPLSLLSQESSSEWEKSKKIGQEGTGRFLASETALESSELKNQNVQESTTPYYSSKEIRKKFFQYQGPENTVREDYALNTYQSIDVSFLGQISSSEGYVLNQSLEILAHYPLCSKENVSWFHECTWAPLAYFSLQKSSLDMERDIAQTRDYTVGLGVDFFPLNFRQYHFLKRANPFLGVRAGVGTSKMVLYGKDKLYEYRIFPEVKGLIGTIYRIWAPDQWKNFPLGIGLRAEIGIAYKVYEHTGDELLVGMADTVTRWPYTGAIGIIFSF